MAGWALLEEDIKKEIRKRKMGKETLQKVKPYIMGMFL